jgi:hypothetical protein
MMLCNTAATNAERRVGSTCCCCCCCWCLSISQLLQVLQACAPGVREHVQHVVLWLAGIYIFWRPECLLLLPILLPLGFYLSKRVG